MLYTLRFFLSSKCSFFHNVNLFCSCIIHILYTGCAKIKKKNSGAKRLIGVTVDEQHKPFLYSARLEVLTAIKLNSQAVWDVNQCHWASSYHCVGGSQYLSSSKHRQPLAQRLSVTHQKTRNFLLVQNVAKKRVCLPLSVAKMKVLKHQFLTRISLFVLHWSYSIYAVDFWCQLHFH